MDDVTPLRRLRKATGLNQVTLAAAIQRSQSYLSALERGEVQPTSGDLTLLSQALGTDLSVYFPSPRTANA
jgi:transcriptional regulator with XRE-family HTH domain